MCFSHAWLLHLSPLFLLPLTCFPYLLLRLPSLADFSQGKVNWVVVTSIPIFLFHRRSDDREMRSSRWLWWSPRAAELDLQYRFHSHFKVYTFETKKYSGYTSLFFYDSSESSLTAARKSQFLPRLPLSKQNILDEFQAKVWQLFLFELRLQDEKNIEMNG